MTTYNTLLLDQVAWDLVIDSSGNIALASPPYALAQDVASAVKLFLGELWYDITKGIPWGPTQGNSDPTDAILGTLPPLSLLTGYIEAAAKTVPGVVTAQCIISQFAGRTITGQIQFVDENNVPGFVTF